MQNTADYLRTKGVDIVWGPRVRETYSRADICDPTAITSSSANGSDEPMEEASKILYRGPPTSTKSLRVRLWVSIQGMDITYYKG